MSIKNESTPLNSDFVATTEFKSKVIVEVLRPYYYDNVKEITENSQNWRRKSQTSFNVALIFHIIGIIATAVSGIIKNDYVLVISIVFASASVGLHCYSVSATAQSRGETKALNSILESLGILPAPDISIQSAHSSNEDDEN